MSRHFVPDHFGGWLSQLEFESRRVLARSGRPSSDHDDIVSIVVAQAWEAGVDLMNAYESARTYANVRTRHAAESYYRSNRAQRGEGSRLRRSTEGDLTAGRTGLSIDATMNAGSISGGAIAVVDGPEERVVGEMDVSDSVREVLAAIGSQVPADDIVDYVLVHALDMTVAEVADRRGVTRETASRRISRVRRAIEQHLAGFTPPV